MDYFCKIAIIAGLLTRILPADGFILFPRPYPLPLSVKYHRVKVDINNGVAHTAVDQVFVNHTSDLLTGGEYLFPLPSGAAISQFSIEVDGIQKPASLMERDEAEAFFAGVVKSSSQAALLAYTQNRAYKLKLAGLPPGKQTRIKLSYTEVLKKQDGLSSYLYPLNTEKFSYHPIDTVSIDVSITNANPITSVYSPSHTINLHRPDKFTVKASYASFRTRPNQDFKLYYKLSSSELSFHLFPFKNTDEDGYFLMLITPKYLDATGNKDIVPKDIVFTIDKSGSMRGIKIAQARDALTFCLNRLNSQDNFNIVAFNHALTSNAPNLLSASISNLPPARQFVASINSGGSTNIGLALKTSMERIKPSELPHYLIFLTDGLPTAGITDRNGISNIVRTSNIHNTRLFSIGFGHNVNTILLDQVSDQNGGFALFCDPNENIETVVSQLYRMIENPILTYPKIEVAGVSIHSLLPPSIPDLFAGSELALFGRYRGRGPASVTLSGLSGGQPKSFTYATSFPSENTEFDFVPRLWATQKIAQLMADVKNSTLTKAQEDNLVDTIKTLSLAFGILTPYTSILFTAPKGGNDLVYNALKDSVGRRANRLSNYQNAMQQNSKASQSITRDANHVSMYFSPQRNQMQNIGDKVFVYSADSLWTDALVDSSRAFDTVSFGSAKYFALAASNPELLHYMTVGNRAVINYQGKNHLILGGNDLSTAVKHKDLKLPAILGGEFLALPAHGGIRFILPLRNAVANLEVFSTQGRLLKSLAIEPSFTELFWDAKNASGNMVAAGLCNARFRVGNQALNRRFVVLR